MVSRITSRAGSAIGYLLLPAQILLSFVTTYLGLLTVAAWIGIARGRHRTELRRSPRTCFAVLVPAHDEERLIGSTVIGLMDLDYPSDLFSVHVVADHCTDGTVQCARELGAVVHEHIEPEPRGKGPALSWATRRLAATDNAPDAVLIIDADTQVHRDVLRILDARLAAGADVVQAHYAVDVPELSGATSFRAAALSVRHYLRPLGRTVLGASSGLFGNGMAVRTELLLDHPWSDHLTEDVEFQVGLAQRGVRVDFAPDALVKAEMPASLAASQSQHERWERGRVELARTQVPLLLERSRRLTVRDRWVRADTAMDLLVPPFSILVAASSLVGAASLFVDPTHMSGRLVRRLAAATVIVQVLHVLSGLIMVRAKLVVYLSLIRAPLLVVWKVRLWGRILVPSRKVEWTRTARNEATA